MRDGVRKANKSLLVLAGLLFLFSGLLLHFVLNAQTLLARFPAFHHEIPLIAWRALSILQNLPQGVETAIRMVVFAVCALLIEMAYVGWNGSSLQAIYRRENAASQDLAMTLMGAVQAVPLLSAAASFGVAYLVTISGGYLAHAALLSTVPSVAIQLLLLLTVRSLVLYWQHRWSHAIPFLWQFHRFHHAAQEMTCLNDFRITPMTFAVTGAPALLAAQLLGRPGATQHDFAGAAAAGIYFLVVAAFELNAHFVHSKLDTSYGWLGRHLFISPAFHRIHHSMLPEHRNSNYSTDFIFWDRLFGTYLNPDEVPNRTDLPLGYEGNSYGKGSLLYDYYLRPPIDALAMLLPAALRRGRAAESSVE